MTPKAEDHLHFIANVPNLEELWARHIEIMTDYGFSRLIYGCTNYRTKHTLGDPDDFVILTNYEQEYVSEFVDNGLYLHAPMTLWASKNTGAENWQNIRRKMANTPITADVQRLMELNQKLGVNQGYTISFQTSRVRMQAMVSLCAKPELSGAEVQEIWDAHGADLVLLNNVMHLKIISMPYSAPKRALTIRQIEALQWVSDGKTTQDIALLMGVTVGTVEKHLRLARETLGVETTAQAVMKAALHNQMFLM